MRRSHSAPGSCCSSPPGDTDGGRPRESDRCPSSLFPRRLDDSSRGWTAPVDRLYEPGVAPGCVRQRDHHVYRRHGRTVDEPGAPRHDPGRHHRRGRAGRGGLRHPAGLRGAGPGTTDVGSVGVSDRTAMGGSPKDLPDRAGPAPPRHRRAGSPDLRGGRHLRHGRLDQAGHLDPGLRPASRPLVPQRPCDRGPGRRRIPAPRSTRKGGRSPPRPPSPPHRATSWNGPAPTTASSWSMHRSSTRPPRPSRPPIIGGRTGASPGKSSSSAASIGTKAAT